MEKYFNYSICKLCNGSCCKNYAGSYVPNDFQQPITPEFIVSLLNGGKVAIDWWEGDVLDKDLSVTYFLRPRHKNEAAVKGSWGGECVNFTDGTGCSLDESERPHGCKKLIPDYKDGETNCDYLPEDKADKRSCVIAWYDYQNIFELALDKYHSQ